MAAKFTGKLIEIIKQYPILYDLNHPHYKNIKMKDKAFEEIGDIINENGDEVKRKWRNLRDSFVRFSKGPKTKTGSDFKSRTKWQWADDLEFLRPFISINSTASDARDLSDVDLKLSDSSLPLEMSVESTSPCSQPAVQLISVSQTERSLPLETAQVTPRQQLRLKKRRRKSDDTSSSSSKVVTVLDYENCTSKKELDRIDCYFLAHADFFKKLSHKRQIMVKMKMAEIFNEAELLQLEEDEDNS